ncbi:unnamed protein product, partial [Rotaria magnacalcarata]
IKDVCFSLMADETRDVFGREQLSVVTRVVAPYLSEFYSIINKNFTYFHASSVTNEPFKSVQQTLNLGKKNCSSSATTIKKWAETKWDSRWTSINSIIQNYKVLIKSLEELEDEGTKRSTDARGPLLALTEPLFVVTIFILDCLLDKIKILSDQLNSLDFGKAHTFISSVINQISTLRTEEEFCKLYDKIIEFSVENNIDLSVKNNIDLSVKNNIDLSVKNKEKRLKTTSTRFANCFITATIGQREEIDNKNKFRIYFPSIQ